LALGLFAMLAAPGCDSPACPSEQMEVIAIGNCATAPQRFVLSTQACNVGIGANTGTGLPLRGALGEDRAPLRQGGFLLYGDAPNFRLCQAKRVDFQLDLTCVDAQGNPVCEVVLTEPP
jgi:hypothetical protein